MGKTTFSLLRRPASSLGLDREHSLSQVLIVLRPVTSKVHPAMAVGTKCNDVSRIVGSAIRQSANMVRLKISNTVWSEKWRLEFTTLANALRSLNHIVANDLTSNEYGNDSLSFQRRGFYGFKCLNPEHSQITHDRDRYIVNLFGDAINGSQLKDNGVSFIFFAIRFPGPGPRRGPGRC